MSDNSPKSKRQLMKLRYFKDLVCASSPDLFTLFSSEAWNYLNKGAD